MIYTQYWNQLDKNPTNVAFAETFFGKLAIVIFFGFFLIVLCSWWPAAMVTVIAVTFFPRYRPWWILLGVGLLLVQSHWLHTWMRGIGLGGWTTGAIFPIANAQPYFIIDIFFTILISMALVFLSRRFKIIFAKPITVLCLLLFALSMLATVVSRNIFLWSFVIVFGHFFWYVAYSLQESKTAHTRSTIIEYARYVSIWGGSATPFPKGAAYLQRISAVTPAEYAITRIKGLKLLIWAFVLAIALQVLYLLMYYFEIPILSEALRQYDEHKYLSWWMAWLCLGSNFFVAMLRISVWGHTIIAICRMCGYKALRNTYKPLQAKTIAEFWNRYYFYFKELLVDFFFYPTYFRFSQLEQKRRIILATLAAATFGNFLYHFLVNLNYVVVEGLWNTLVLLQSYAFYCLVLGVAIAISQIRTIYNKTLSDRKRNDFLSSVIVLGFYMLMTVFQTEYQATPLSAGFKFIASLFNFKW